MANVSRILAELILDESDFEKGLQESDQAASKAAKKIDTRFRGMLRSVESQLTRLSTNISNGFNSLGPGLRAASSQLDSIGSRAVENAERFTFLGAAFLGPLALSFKRFADANTEARQKIAELRAEQESLEPFEFVKNQDLELQITNLQKVVKETQQAADTQSQLSTSGRKVLDSLGALITEGLAPYLQWIAETLLRVNAWLKQNPELAKQFILLTAGAGAFFAVLGPGLLIIGKLIRVMSGLVYGLGLLANPIGIAVIAVAALVYAFRADLYPEFEETTKRLRDLWEQFQGGELTGEDAAQALADNVLHFLENALRIVLVAANERYVPQWVNDLFVKEFDAEFRRQENIDSFAESVVGFVVAGIKAASKALNEAVKSLIPDLLTPVNEFFEERFFNTLTFRGGTVRPENTLDPAGILNLEAFEALTRGTVSNLGEAGKALRDFRATTADSLGAVRQDLNEAVGNSWYVDFMENLSASTRTNIDSALSGFSGFASSIDGHLRDAGRVVNRYTRNTPGLYLSTLADFPSIAPNAIRPQTFGFSRAARQQVDQANASIQDSSRRRAGVVVGSAAQFTINGAINPEDLVPKIKQVVVDHNRMMFRRM